MKDPIKEPTRKVSCPSGVSMPDTPGQTIDIADDEKVSEKRVDAYTKSLNNNPRNNK